jgi:hypothetical protein
MIENFRNWYIRNSNEITWFLIGFLTMSGLFALSTGNYTSAALNFVLAWANYALNKR